MDIKETLDTKASKRIGKNPNTEARAGRLGAGILRRVIGASLVALILGSNTFPVFAQDHGKPTNFANGGRNAYYEPNLGNNIVGLEGFEEEQAEQLTPSYIVNILLQEGSKKGLQDIALQYPDLQAFWGNKLYKLIKKGMISDKQATKMAAQLLVEVLFNKPGDLIRYDIAGSVYGYVRVSDAVNSCSGPSCKNMVNTIIHYSLHREYIKQLEKILSNGGDLQEFANFLFEKMVFVDETYGQGNGTGAVTYQIWGLTPGSFFEFRGAGRVVYVVPYLVSYSLDDTGSLVVHGDFVILNPDGTVSTLQVYGSVEDVIGQFLGVVGKDFQDAHISSFQVMHYGPYPPGLNYKKVWKHPLDNMVYYSYHPSPDVNEGHEDKYPDIPKIYDPTNSYRTHNPRSIFWQPPRPY